MNFKWPRWYDLTSNSDLPTPATSVTQFFNESSESLYLFTILERKLGVSRDSFKAMLTLGTMQQPQRITW